MKKHFELLRLTRKRTVALLDLCNETELLKIAPNYNNNILWNAAHSLVSMQLLCYRLSGNAINVNEDYVNPFRKGSTASEEVLIDVLELKKLLVSTAEQLEEDYENGLFKEYNSYPTSYGFTLNSIEDAIVFNNLHEGLHYGYMLAQKKAV